MRRMTVRPETWDLRTAFTISRGSKTKAEVVVVTVEEDGIAGRGECVPYGRYGETVPGVAAALEDMVDAVAGGLDRTGLRRALAPGAARNALDCALWDLEAKRGRTSVWRLAGLPQPAPAVTAETVGLDSPEAMGAAASRLADRPLLKLKLGADDPVARVRAVRAAAPKARLVADANEGWTFPQLSSIAPELAALGVEMIEQPLPAADDGALEGYRCPVALCADESFHTGEDIAALARRYSLVNIKLDKTGGLTEAIDTARAARSAGLGIMVGCMVGTSLAMAPALLLAPWAAFVDLDGPVWLAGDREDGLVFENGVVRPASPTLWG